MSEVKLQSQLTVFDVTNLVVGAIIGADIYVASSFGAEYLGPSSLLVWVVAGIIAIIIALCFAHCATLLPKVGGPYAYAKEAWGTFAGFMAGWSLWLAEWVSLAVFPVAFTRYLMFFLPDLAWIYQTMIEGLFVTFLVATNIVGVKAAGRTNDILTLTKLAPLILFFWSRLGLHGFTSRHDNSKLFAIRPIWTRKFRAGACFDILGVCRFRDRSYSS